MRYSLVASAKAVEAIAPQTNGTKLSGRWLNMGKAARVNVFVMVNQGNASPVSINFKQAKDNAGLEAKAITTELPIWAGEDLSLSDEFVRQDDGVSFETSGTLKHKKILFQIDPAEILDDGFTHLQVVAEASNAANIIAATYIATDLRYGSQVSLID